MNKKMSALFILILLAGGLVSFGCRGKAERLPEAPSLEIPETANLPPETMAELPPAESARQDLVVVTPPQTTSQAEGVPASMPPQGAVRNKAIQTALKKAGYYEGAVDGIVGPRTKKAIKEFQKAKGLAVDGKVGPKTWAELEKYLT